MVVATVSLLIACIVLAGCTDPIAAAHDNLMIEQNAKAGPDRICAAERRLAQAYKAAGSSEYDLYNANAESYCLSVEAERRFAIQECCFVAWLGLRVGGGSETGRSRE